MKMGPLRSPALPFLICIVFVRGSLAYLVLPPDAALTRTAAAMPIRQASLERLPPALQQSGSFQLADLSLTGTLQMAKDDIAKDSQMQTKKELTKQIDNSKIGSKLAARLAASEKKEAAEQAGKPKEGEVISSRTGKPKKVKVGEFY
ncbi:unnamed protein product [Vitrella brassicaformis CCMP3155]|uniref:Uncharacterized protein n=2 Tax=Vitrella brassicaformis TaxID=1169539 RepID=A0A0G4H6T2_VITBC|nr:unnamed protein product [Vitrella brassicaformis CCMP3155]|eukprot:CEM39512.1 unnamed protein product [Vitrella brassicaformis CCMP3155]